MAKFKCTLPPHTVVEFNVESDCEDMRKHPQYVEIFEAMKDDNPDDFAAPEKKGKKKKE